MTLQSKTMHPHTSVIYNGPACNTEPPVTKADRTEPIYYVFNTLCNDINNIDVFYYIYL